MELKEDRIIHRFIKDISEYESGGEYYNQVIPADTQAYAIYSASEKSGLYYVMGDDAHTYTEIRDGYGSKKSAKEYPVFTTEYLNTINRKADKSYVDTEFVNAENKWTAQVNAERSRAEGAENTITIALNDETARAVLEEDTLDKKIVAETNRATAAENKITSDLNTHTNNKNNPHSVTKAQVGLGNCDNTSDVNKPISTATQAALDTLTTNLETEVNRATGRENSINNALTAEITRATNREDTIEADLNVHSTSNTNPHNVTKAQVGLGNCDNTSDVNKPVSKATQQELDTLTDNLNTEVTRATTKEDLINSALSSEVIRAKAAEKTLTDNLEEEITRATDKETAVETSLNTHKTNKSNPHEVTKSQVGLGNCDNTADIDKPISTAVQSALNGKADKATTISGYNITDAYTKEEIENTYAKSVNVPTKVSQLENDSGYLTTHQDISGKADLSYVDEELIKKQDVISDLETIREGAQLGSTALQSVPEEYVTEAELNAKGYLTSYTETDPVYSADKPNLALKSEIPTIPTNVSSFTNDAGYLTEIPEEYLTVEEAARVYATNADVAEKANTADLAAVATSGNYNDLENKPTKVSEFTNDSGYLTEHQDISDKADITYVNEQVAVKQDILSGAKGEVFYSNGNSVFSQTILNESKVVTTTADLNACKNNAPSFEEVFNTWTKFSHLDGNDNAVASELSAWTYDSSKDTIVQPQNTTSYCGFISPNTYSEYDITVRLYSTGSDDDTIGLVAAFATDPSGKQHTLSFLRSPGGTDAKWICKVDYCTFAMTQTTYNQITLADKSSTITGSDDNWSTSTIGTGTIVNMKRNGNVFTAKCSQFNSSVLDDNTTITIDLDALSSTYPVLNYFKGSAAWGYSTFSQPYSMYENISVTDPSGYILDVKNNQTLQYDSSSSSWKVIKGLVPTEVIGAGRLSYNKITGKLFYCTGSTIFQIATNANI